MAKIETTLPTIAFGNVKVTFTPEELGVDISDAAAIGVATAVYLNLFTQGFKTGSQMDVSAPVAASESEVDRVIDETLANAQKLVQDGLGASEVTDELGFPSGNAPTEAPWEAKVDAKPKPWETEEKPAPVALTPGW